LLGGVGTEQGAELVGEGRHVGDGGLKVQVEAVHGRFAEGAESGGVVAGRAEGLPDAVGSGDGGGLTGEAAFGVGCTANGEEDGLAEGLTDGDVFSVGRLVVCTLLEGVEGSTLSEDS
jgi:hypothetical protein